MRTLSTTILLALFAAAPAAAETATGGSFAEFDRRAQAGEPLSVVFFGASLTWGANATDQAHTSYRAVIADLLAKRYPKSPIRCHDAAIGGTGSQLGAFRVERDVLSRKPDLVFLDFSANDDIYIADPETLASYEAIVRRLVVEAKVPVVQVAFPFKWNINKEQLPTMKRRLAHRAIAEAYGSGWGDAIELTVNEVAAGRVTTDAVWNSDPVHPGDVGYRLFAAAAWSGFEQAVADKRVGQAPAAMLNPATYTTLNRVHLTGLGKLPAGWSSAPPHLTALYYDFQMSRWADELAVVSNRRSVKGADGKPVREPQAVEPLRLTVQASTVLLFGEATATSGRFRLTVDGQVLTGRQDQEKGTDLVIGNRWKTGSGHLVIEVARGLDPAVPHVIEILPAFTTGQDEELRIESVCVAGGKATVALAAPKP
jgi:lysophospholipase L1-like esterase